MGSNENKNWFGMIVVIVCLAVIGTTLADWPQQTKLTASDGAANDHFGYSVYLSGDYAIVGAFGCSSDTGSAYIFKRNGTNWIQQTKLTASDGAADDWFGCSVAIDGQHVIVGAEYDDAKGSGSGSAYIFAPNDIDPNNWYQQAKLYASDAEAEDYFGSCVSLSGNYAIVGAPENGWMLGGPGSAYIFYWNGASWIEQAKLTASGGDCYDYFGWSVSISGDYAIIGAFGDDDNGIDSGAAYIFKRTGTTWVQQNKLTASDGIANDEFGCSVSISGDYSIVGAQRDYGNAILSGSAYIFKRSDDPNDPNWYQHAKVTVSDGGFEDLFGWSVSISEGYAIIGTPYDDDNGNTSGSAYIFKRDDMNWTEQAKLTASDGAARDYFGWSVSISGEYTIVGADWDDDKGSGSGSAYIFKRVCPTADLSGDCFVDFIDFSIMAGQWLQGN